MLSRGLTNLVLVTIFALASSAVKLSGAVAVENKYGPQSGWGNINITATVSSAPNRLMLVVFGTNLNSATSVTGIVWNGTDSLTRLNGASSAASGVEIWYKLNPSVGNSQTVAISANTGGNRDFAEVYVLTGVDQTTGVANFVSNTGSGQNSTISVASDPWGLVIDVLSTGSPVTSLAPTETGQTLDWTQADGYGGGSERAGQTTTAMSWSWTNGVWFAHAGCNVIAVAIGGGPCSASGAGAISGRGDVSCQ